MSCRCGHPASSHFEGGTCLTGRMTLSDPRIVFCGCEGYEPPADEGVEA
jgi:hypothetical protein